MKDPLGVSPSKRNQGTTRGEEKIILTRWESNPRIRSTVTLPTELRGRTDKVGDGRSNPEVVGSIPTVVKIIFFFTSCGSLISFTRANAQWVFHGFHTAL